MNGNTRYYLLIFIIVFADCVKPFNLPALQAKDNYLVVDGFINTGSNGVTTINLTRTTSVTDSVFITEPELNASSTNHLERWRRIPVN